VNGIVVDGSTADLPGLVRDAAAPDADDLALTWSLRRHARAW
jgi:hypothetical protein